MAMWNSKKFDDSPAEMTIDEASAELVATVARHFDEAMVEGDVVRTMVGGPGGEGVSIRAWVDSFHEVGRYRAPSLFFQIWGGSLGAVRKFASITGYGETVRDAVITGGCNWSCVIRPLLAAANGKRIDSSGLAADVQLELSGRPVRLVADGVDRWLATGDSRLDATSARRLREALARGASDSGFQAEFAPYAGPGLLPPTGHRDDPTPSLSAIVATSGLLPPMPAQAASLLSVFVAETGAGRTVEVKFNGEDRPAAHRVFAGESTMRGEDGAILLRELAVLIRLG